MSQGEVVCGTCIDPTSHSIPTTGRVLAGLHVFRFGEMRTFGWTCGFYVLVPQVTGPATHRRGPVIALALFSFNQFSEAILTSPRITRTRS